MIKLLILFLVFAELGFAGEIVESIVAIVNGSIITKSDMVKYKDRLKSGSIVDDLLNANPDVLLKDEKALLKHLIDEKIIDDEVKRQGLSATFERVEQEITSIQSRNKISRDQLVEALKQEGTRFSDYQAFIKTRIERQSVIEKVITSKIKISDDDIIAYYESKNKKMSASSFEFKVAHILFRQGKRSDDAQLTRAQDVLAKLKKGDSFDSLASQYSEDPNFNEGGVLGSFKSGEFLKPLEDAVRTLAPGEVAGPVKTKLGYHLIKLLERHVVPDAEFEKKKDQLRGELYQKAFVKQFQFWLDQKRQEAFIKIN